MKDGEELQVTCKLCEKHTAFVRQIATDLGSVKIRECMVCDRGRCDACGQSLPGWAKKCLSSTCGKFVDVPSSSAVSRMRHPSGWQGRLAEAERLVVGMSDVAHHPHLHEAKEWLASLRRAA